MCFVFWSIAHLVGQQHIPKDNFAGRNWKMNLFSFSVSCFCVSVCFFFFFLPNVYFMLAVLLKKVIYM